MVEPARKPDILTQRLEAAKSLQVAGGNENWDASIAAYEATIEEFGINTGSLNGMGVPLRMRKRHPEAIQAFTLARGLAQKANDQEAELTAVTGLMDAWRTADRCAVFPYPQYITEDKRKSYLHTISASFIPDTKSLMAQITSPSLAQVEAWTNGIGLIYNDMGNLQEALQAYGQAEEIARQLLETNPQNIDFKNRLARTLTTKGEAQEGLGDLNSALDSLSESLDLQIQLGDLRGIGNAKVSKGRVLRKMGNLDDARDLLKQAQSGAMKDVKINDQEVYDNAVKELEKFKNIPS